MIKVKFSLLKQTDNLVWVRHFVLVVIQQDAVCCALKVIILVVPQGPQESGKTNKAKREGNRDQVKENIHLAILAQIEPECIQNHH